MAEPKVLKPGDVGYHEYPKLAEDMESLGDIYARMNFQAAWPADAFCSTCLRVLPDHPHYLAWEADHPDTGIRKCRCHIRVAEHLAQANFPPDGPRTFDRFNPREGTEDMVGQALEFLDHEGPRRMVISGAYGCGKSHIVEAIGREWLGRWGRVRYEGVPTLLDLLRATYDRDNPASIDTILRWYYGFDLLILDDLGAEKSNAGEDGFVAEQLTKIWDNFRNYLILTTNKTQKETADKLGDRLASRMYSANPDLNEVRFVINTAGDYRA